MQWKKLKEEPYKAGYRKMIKKFFELPHGKVIDFDVKDEGKPVSVFALTVDNEVVLAKQFRPGPERILIELPGGGREEGESLLEAAARELLEETGYQGEIEHIGSNVECAYSTRECQIFLARNCKKVSEPQPDENEFTEVVLMNLPDFRKHLQTGELTDSVTAYRCLDHLGWLK